MHTDGHMKSWKKFVPSQSPPLDLGDYTFKMCVYMYIVNIYIYI